MHSRDLIQRRVLVDGVPQTIYINKRTGRPIARLSQRQLEHLRLMYGEGFWGELWDKAKKVVEVGKKVYDVAKPIYDGAKKGYDVYKTYSGKGVRVGLPHRRGQFQSRVPFMDGGSVVYGALDQGLPPRRKRSEMQLSKHINRSLRFD